MEEFEAAFWATLAALPDDDLPKLVFADCLDEHGDQRGDCLRWMVAEHKRPAFDRHDTKTWDWWSHVPADPLHYELSPREYLLPLNLFTRLTPFGSGIWKGDPTFVTASQNLCRAWRECVREGIDPLADDRPRVESDAGLAAKSSSGV